MTNKITKVWEYGMQVLDTDFKQRAKDSKWERIIKTLDYDNKYSYISEAGNRVTLVPEKWVTVGVYDLLMEYVE